MPPTASLTPEQATRATRASLLALFLDVTGVTAVRPLFRAPALDEPVVDR